MYQILLFQISEGIPNVYLFVNPKYPSLSKYANKPIYKLLQEHSDV